MEKFNALKYPLGGHLPTLKKMDRSHHCVQLPKACSLLMHIDSIISALDGLKQKLTCLQSGLYTNVRDNCGTNRVVSDTDKLLAHSSEGDCSKYLGLFEDFLIRSRPLDNCCGNRTWINVGKLPKFVDAMSRACVYSQGGDGGVHVAAAAVGSKRIRLESEESSDYPGEAESEAYESATEEESVSIGDSDVGGDVMSSAVKVHVPSAGDVTTMIKETTALTPPMYTLWPNKVDLETLDKETVEA